MGECKFPRVPGNRIWEWESTLRETEPVDMFVHLIADHPARASASDQPILREGLCISYPLSLRIAYSRGCDQRRLGDESRTRHHLRLRGGTGHLHL